MTAITAKTLPTYLVPAPASDAELTEAAATFRGVLIGVAISAPFWAVVTTVCVMR